MSNYNTLKTADTINAISIVDGAITTSKLNASVTTLIVSGSGPKVAAITYPGNDLAADPAGGQTITLTGTGFVSGCSVFVGTTQASVVTVVSATSVTFTAPALAAATYTLYLVNPDGGTATIVPGISYSGTPIWSTAAGTLGSVYEYAAISNTVAATGDGSIIYSVFSGTLPTGSSLNTSTGVITGTSPASAGATTYTFVIRATDAQLQDSDRSFSITVNTDVVTWSTPAANSTVTLGKDVASSTALLATSAAGNAITYTANTLPTGLSISGATVTGTPTVIASTTSTFTATAATTNKTTTAVINWTVSVAADTYFPYTTLLLSGAAATETFVADASVNNFAVTIAGDTKPNNFNPYTPGYYSNYITTGAYLTTPATVANSGFSTGDFTVEAWIYPTVAQVTTIVSSNYSYSTAAGNWAFYFAVGSAVNLYFNGGAASASGANHASTATATIPINQWTHVAYSRTSAVGYFFVNGVQLGTGVADTSGYSGAAGTLYIGRQADGTGFLTGYISNLRIVKGTGVYTASFTPSTTPLTAISGTSLLTCQSNRFIDNSTNAFTITVAGNTTVNSFTPFVPNTAYATQGSTYFNGTTDYLLAPSSSQFNLPGDFTIECWIYKNNPAVDGNGIFGIGTTDPDSNLVRISTGKLQFWLGGSNSGASGTGTKTGIITCATSILSYVWYHVALVRSGSAANNVKLYLNGVLDGQGTGTYQIPTNYFVVARDYPTYSAEYFPGYISNVRVVKGVAVYTANFTPPVAPLSATQSETSLSTPPTVEYLVVAGGGGAGGSSGGGGGAGGYRTASGFAVAANTAITVTVGAGGSGGAANTKGSAGLNSVFSTITATGGGAGGTGYSGGDMNGGNGGSGGGAGYYGDGTFGTPIGGISSPVTSPVQGYAGGAADPSNNIGGGGGGAGAVGSGGSGTTGAGGIGVQSSITGAATYYAGGGAGWSRNTASLGGLGGGGNESTAGTANTGGGGGAHADYTLGGFAGGSGVVVIRYADTYVAATCTGSPEITIAGGYRIYKFVTSGTMYITFNTETKAAITGSATSLLTCQTNQPASNSMFLDSSTNAFAVTRAGNTSAGTFTPYGANWSNYFDGAADGLVMPAGLSTAMGAGFAGNIISFEMWIFPTSFTNGGAGEGNGIMGAYAAVSANGRWVVSMERSATTTAKLQMAYTIGTGSQVNIESTASAITLNQWNHIAITVDATTAASSTIKLFANGVLLNTFTGQNMSTQTAYYRPVYVGDVQSQYVAAMVGYISNFRILKGAFAYTGNYTVPTAPLTAIANTVLLTCQSNSFVDNSANAFTITKTGDVAVQRFSPFSPQTQTAITHSAYYGTKTDYISIPATAALTTFTGDFTFECWVNPTDTSISTNWGIWDSRQNGQTASAMIFTLQNLASPVTGQWRLSYYYGSGTQTYGTGIVLANQWTHVAFVRSGSTLTYYVNGVAGGTATVSGTQTGSATSNPVYIGTKDGSLGGYGTVGYISNFRIVKGVAVYTGNFTVPTAPLSATQSSGTNIAAITGTQTSLLTLQSPTLIDNSTNALVITSAGTATPRTFNPFGFTNASAAYSAATYGGSAYFDGTTDYLTAPANSAFQFTGDYTVEFWVNFSSVATEVDLVGNYASNVGTDWMILKTANGAFQYYPSSAASYIIGPTPVANRWYHVVIGRIGTSCKLYVDGISYGTPLTFSGTLGDASKSVYIGSRGGSTNLLTGYISNVRIVKGTAVYTSNFVPPAAPLTAITNTSLLLNMTSAGVYDSASGNNLETVADAKRVATQTPYAGSYYSNYFDGSSNFTSSTSQIIPTGSFTVECWVYVTSTANQAFVAQGTSANAARFSIAIDGGLWWTQIGNASINTGTPIINTWNYLAVTFNGSTLTLYVNGTSIGTLSTSTSAQNTTLSIGTYGPSWAGYFATGYISNVRVSSVVRTIVTPTAPYTSDASTRLLTCQSNRFVDNSSNAFALTATGTPTVQSFNPFQRNSATTMSFDGTGDWLFGSPSVQNQLTGNFTIECWAYPTTLGSQMGIVTITATSASGTNGLAIYFDTSNKISFWVNGNGGTVVTTTAYTANQWYHIALVRNGTTNTLYVNGVSSASNSVTPTWPTTPAIGIGRIYNDNSSYSMTGYINDLRITKGVARYTSTFTPPTTAFITR